MTTTINPNLISSPNPLTRSPFTETLHITVSNCTRPFNAPALYSRCRPQTVKCNSNNNDSSPSEKGSLKDVLSGMVDQRVEELLNKEENRGLLDGLGKATERVEIARRELAEIKKQEIEAQQLRDYINQLENRASEIAECQRDITEARALVEEAERSLTVDGVGGRDAFTEIELEAINKNEERWESIKAASISAVVGTLAGLPISLTQVTSFPQLILPSAITFVSCALFGVTFRYAVRRDFDNFQLKNGTAAAFGFVKGLATLGGGPPLELTAGSLFSHAYSGAIYVSENVLIFVFAAVGLDFCIKMRILSSYPIERSISETR